MAWAHFNSKNIVGMLFKKELQKRNQKNFEQIN